MYTIRDAITRRRFLQCAALAAGRRGSEFVFARLRYESGDWDYNPKVAANVLDSIMQYTAIPVDRDEVIISASSTAPLSCPFVFMTGHRLVRFSAIERRNLLQFADAGGLLFSDDCNRDVNGLYAKTFEQEMRAVFPADPLAKLPASHPVYRAFFHSRADRPRRRTSSTAGATTSCGATRVSARGQHEVRRQHRRLRDDVNES